MNRPRAQKIQNQRLEQIHLLQVTTQAHHSRKEWTRRLTWLGIAVVVICCSGFGLQLGCSAVLDRTLYASPHYALQEILIEPRDRFSAHQIRETAGLEIGQNLWTLNLPKISHDLETLPNVANARVERHFPDRLIIRLTERIPVVKIVGMNVDQGTQEVFYLDRDCYVLKPRANEPALLLPEITGLINEELEPGTKLESPVLVSALHLLNAIDRSQLRTAMDVRTIDLSQPLCIRMVTTHDMTITFRLDCVNQQLDRLQQILDLPEMQQRSIRTVDLSLDHNVPVSFFDPKI